LERAGLRFDSPAWDGASTTVADELLLPSVLYTPGVRAALAVAEVHAVAHITGGGFAGNIPRSLPDGCRAIVEQGTWEVPRIFEEIRRHGQVDDAEMARVFNLGLGMVLMVSVDTAELALAALRAAGLDAVTVGRVEGGDHGVEMVGPSLWPARDD